MTAAAQTPTPLASNRRSTRRQSSRPRFSGSSRRLQSASQTSSPWAGGVWSQSRWRTLCRRRPPRSRLRRWSPPLSPSHTLMHEARPQTRTWTFPYYSQRIGRTPTKMRALCASGVLSLGCISRGAKGAIPFAKGASRQCSISLPRFLLGHIKCFVPNAVSLQISPLVNL